MGETLDMTIQTACALALGIVEIRPEWVILAVKTKSPYDASGEGYVVQCFHKPAEIHLTIAVDKPRHILATWLDETVEYHVKQRARGFSREAH